MTTLSAEQRRHQIWSVIRVSSGNFLEMYDFFVFGYYASAIGKAFFPNGSEFAQLMLAFMTFGAGFLMRPLGGIFLGAYIDHHGRRSGLMLTLAFAQIVSAAAQSWTPITGGTNGLPGVKSPELFVPGWRIAYLDGGGVVLLADGAPAGPPAGASGPLGSLSAPVRAAVASAQPPHAATTNARPNQSVRVRHER